jgi:hypothetical protein
MWQYFGSLIHKMLNMIRRVTLFPFQAITPKDEYVITCDRDEKIRVSNYLNAYNIHTYCLGHSE